MVNELLVLFQKRADEYKRKNLDYKDRSRYLMYSKILPNVSGEDMERLWIILRRVKVLLNLGVKEIQPEPTS